MDQYVACSEEPTAEDTRRNAQGDDALAGQAVVSVAHDADEQARNLIGWRQTYDQLAAGRFVGTLTELPLDTMKLFRESTSHLLRRHARCARDAYWFGIPLVSDGTRASMRRIGPGALAFRPGNVEFELVTPAQFSIYGVVVRGDVLRRYAEEVEHCALDERLFTQRVMQVGDARLARQARCSADGSTARWRWPARWPMRSATTCRARCWPRCSTRARSRPTTIRAVRRRCAAGSSNRRATTCSRTARARSACPSCASSCT